MADLWRGPHLWRGLFLLLAVVFLYFRLLPISRPAGTLPGPDLLMCVACAWVVRRPDFVPALLIAGVVLVEDLLLMRPPGLWAALMLLGTEFLRSRAAFTRELGFVSEWLLVAMVMTAMMVGYRVIAAVAFLPQPGLALTMVQLTWSVLAYPAVVAVSRLAFGLRKPATGEVDAIGRPI